MRVSRIIVNVILLLSSCISPFDLVDNFQEVLVVEGLITDQPGPYVVKLSKSIPATATAQLDEPVFVSGASVVIHDDQGNSETLNEKSSGNYYTSSFQGVIGRTYSITITTDEGSTYQSAPEKLEPVGDFANLRYEFAQNEPAPPIYVHFPLGAEHHIESRNGFNVYIDSKVLAEQEGRVWWRWIGTFKIFTHPELQVEVVTTPGPAGHPVAIPAAPPCSGYDVIFPHTPRAKLFGPLRPCTCCICWTTEYNSYPILSDPKFVNGNGGVNNFKIAFIDANRRTFYEKYHLQVEQLSVSPTIYNFWKRVLVQKSNSSNLFQTPSPKTGGNITASSTNAIPAIGYFAASSVKTHSISILRSDVPYNVGIIDTIAVSCNRTYACCTTKYKYSTTVKPLFW
jgi:hypothetical protein